MWTRLSSWNWMCCSMMCMLMVIWISRIAISVGFAKTFSRSLLLLLAAAALAGPRPNPPVDPFSWLGRLLIGFVFEVAAVVVFAAAAAAPSSSSAREPRFVPEDRSVADCVGELAVAAADVAVPVSPVVVEEGRLRSRRLSRVRSVVVEEGWSWCRRLSLRGPVVLEEGCSLCRRLSLLGSRVSVASVFEVECACRSCRPPNCFVWSHRVGLLLLASPFCGACPSRLWARWCPSPHLIPENDGLTSWAGRLGGGWWESSIRGRSRRCSRSHPFWVPLTDCGLLGPSVRCLGFLSSYFFTSLNLFVLFLSFVFLNNTHFWSKGGLQHNVSFCFAKCEKLSFWGKNFWPKFGWFSKSTAKIGVSAHF